MAIGDCDDGSMVMASARRLLGKQVRVHLDEKVVSEGQLLRACDGGEVVLRDEMGFLHFCWPMLQIEEIGGPGLTITEPGAPLPASTAGDPAGLSPLTEGL